MDPSRKRKIRLVVALGAAVVLAGALMLTSFAADTPATTPSQLLAKRGSGDYKLTGKVVDGSVKRNGEELAFAVRDRDGTEQVPVKYAGVVPDPFREGREVIVAGRLQNGTFVAQRDSLITKCPSKFKNATDSGAKPSS
ncbi:MAG: cytochrome c-type biosis protein CcmE [Thermoleophilales bacterium]|jgi:cytochrome c-type biogenesis protein CcmE|nr:cytochrome c-type biosis protein CcmE [Thermoleophilales bacterium]